jgi:hypothetical protein
MDIFQEDDKVRRPDHPDWGIGTIYRKLTRRSGWVEWENDTATLELFKNLEKERTNV